MILLCYSYATLIILCYSYANPMLLLCYSCVAPMLLTSYATLIILCYSYAIPIILSHSYATAASTWLQHAVHCMHCFCSRLRGISYPRNYCHYKIKHDLFLELLSTGRVCTHALCYLKISSVCLFVSFVTWKFILCLERLKDVVGVASCVNVISPHHI